MSINNNLAMYLIIKESLNLPSGKMAAQVAHAATMLHEKYNKDQIFKTWLNSGMTKIVLKASDSEFEKLKQEINSVLVIDAGFTVVASSTETVVGLKPMNKENASKLIKTLRLA